MVRVAVVGSGFGGIGMAVRLKQAGIVDLTVFEATDDVGGVWRDNTYPGAACDVASHLYSFSFAPEGGWSRRFAPQPEIHAYLRRVAQEAGVLPHVRFSTEVRTATWDEGTATWRLRLSTGQEHEADVLVTACGQLRRPSVPHVPGLDRFAGTSFHSARWDHDHDLSGERVAVLGTGASAIQFVPEIVDRVASLTVFQRSAPYVLPKPDRAYGRRTHALLRHVPATLAADRLRTYVVNEARSLGFNTEPRLMALHQHRFRRHLSRSVPDPDLRARLTPDYTMGCKRILQSNDWYPALVRPHVRVVHERVVEVEPHALRTADGVRHPVDTIVLGTGFAATELLVPMQVHGRGGRSLGDAWTDGAEAYLGTVVSGFPNLFVLYGPNTNLGHNSIVHVLESQFAYVLDAVRLLQGGVRSLDVHAPVQAAFNDEVQRRMRGTVFAGGCTSWYQTASGRNTQNWPGSTLELRARLRRVRLQDFSVETRPAGVAA